MSWENAIYFEKGEKIISSWMGDRETITKSMYVSQYGGGSYDAKIRKKGILALTNHRFLFLEERGFFDKSYHQTLTIPLTKVSGISAGGTFMPFVSIANESENFIFHLTGIGQNEFPKFKESIMNCCNKRLEELEAEKKKDRIQIVFDFSMLKEYMDNGGLILQKTKCPECNAPIPIPTTGNQIVCKHCGSTILAQDIFEKIKSLI